jgi:hypothetical protein
MNRGPGNDRPALSGREFLAVSGLTIAAATIAGLTVLVFSHGSVRLLLAAMLSVLVGLVPLRLLCRTGVESVPTVWMACTLIRMLTAVTVSGGLLWQGATTPVTTVAMVLATYLVATFVEAGVLARTVWSK